MTSSSSLQEYVAALDKLRHCLPQRDGGWKIGEGVFSHGVDLLAETLNPGSYFRIFVVNATGREPEDRFCRWLESAFIGMSWPDPRIWCNMIGSLAASARTTSMSATLAGVIASDSTLYSARTLFGSMGFILSYVEAINSGGDGRLVVDQYKKSEAVLRIPGFARPIANGDMRVDIMLEVDKKLGYERGAHMKAALKLSEKIQQEYGQSINFAGYLAAFLADNGYSPEEAYRFFSIITNSGITACYADDIKKPAGHFLPLRCDDIEYRGVASRALPPSAL